ncbi:MAG TPA: hypothetical protein VHJ34_06250 [Actinomycetota bacterium]|nr:hypothetical protein [Actinomycetota bacterium]
MSGIVNVPVPEEHLGAVYGLLARLSNEASGDGKARPAPGDASKTQPEWWNEKRLRKAYDESSPAQQIILKAMAAGRGQWVAVSDIVAELGDGADWNTMAGALGALGRRMKNRYKAKERPFTIRYNNERGENEYLMPKSIAAIIRSF